MTIGEWLNRKRQKNILDTNSWSTMSLLSIAIKSAIRCRRRCFRHEPRQKFRRIENVLPSCFPTSETWRYIYRFNWEPVRQTRFQNQWEIRVIHKFDSNIQEDMGNSFLFQSKVDLIFIITKRIVIEEHYINQQLNLLSDPLFKKLSWR